MSRRLLLLLPAQRGEEIKSRSRDAAQHPSYDTPRSRKRETECEERQVVEPAWFFATAALQNVARMKPTGPARTRSGSLPGFRCAPPGLRRKRKNRRRNADRRNGRSPCRTGTAAPPYGRRTSIGVPPRFLLRRPNATAQLQSALPGMGPVSGRYPQTGPSQYSEAPRRPVVLPVGRVPEAARERVASPRHLRPARARSVTISTDKALWRVSFMSHHVAVCSRRFPGISEE